MTHALGDDKRVIVGIDAGYSNVGLAVLEVDRGLELVHVEVFRSVKDSDARWVLADDLSRINAQVLAVERVLRAYKPDVVAVEAFAPRRGKGGGSSWKSAFGFASNVTAAIMLGCAVEARWPQDLRRALELPGDADKEAVARAVAGVLGRRAVEAIEDCAPKGRREHAFDAAGHAIAAAWRCP